MGKSITYPSYFLIMGLKYTKRSGRLSSLIIILDKNHRSFYNSTIKK
jgi:hypothetical protein